MAGAVDGFRKLAANYRVVIFTARHDLEHVSDWLVENGFGRHEVTNRKPRAEVYLDDKALRFESWDAVLRDVARVT